MQQELRTPPPSLLDSIPCSEEEICKSPRAASLVDTAEESTVTASTWAGDRRVNELAEVSKAAHVIRQPVTALLTNCIVHLEQI